MLDFPEPEEMHFSPLGVLLGHIVCKKGLLVDPPNISIIVDLHPQPYFSQTIAHYDGTYWILQEVH
jgi:hypothetical protein